MFLIRPYIADSPLNGLYKREGNFFVRILNFFVFYSKFIRRKRNLIETFAIFYDGLITQIPDVIDDLEYRRPLIRCQAIQDTQLVFEFYNFPAYVTFPCPENPHLFLLSKIKRGLKPRSIRNSCLINFNILRKLYFLLRILSREMKWLSFVLT